MPYHTAIDLYNRGAELELWSFVLRAPDFVVRTGYFAREAVGFRWPALPVTPC